MANKAQVLACWRAHPDWTSTMMADEIHGWRTCYSVDLFYVWVRFGFFSLAFSRLLVSEALKRIEAKLGSIGIIKHEGTVE